MNNSTEKLPEEITLLDRFSDLPDELLCQILSFLRTKEAVATSILSKRWKFLWYYVDTLYFDYVLGENVNRTLQLHRGLIKRMFCCYYGKICNKDDIVTWIETAISKKVQTLHLMANYTNHKWPLCLFHSQTLVELRLWYADITNIDIPTAPCFPKLKKLHLCRPYCKSDFINALISWCPILEYLNLDFSETPRLHAFVEGCNISSATLKTVRINCNIYSDNPKIVLNTPALEVLEIQNTANLEFLVESSMPSLHKADISISFVDLYLTDNPNSDFSLKYLEFLCNMSAQCCRVQDFYHSRTLYKSNLHAHFNNLTQLDIIGHQFGLDLLKFFIEKCNNLKVITVKRV